MKPTTLLALVALLLASLLAGSGCITTKLYEATIGASHPSASREVTPTVASVEGRDPEGAVIHLHVRRADGSVREYVSLPGSAVAPAGAAPRWETLPRSNL
ncbi:MAG TPA: hypothetical protein VHF22_10710, partial [Planctomycetota bacterium]|nr:hypothetical protein [Planctomycetota bacterium]